MTKTEHSVSTLVILAAGRGTRFGSAKQFALFGRYQKTLMQYNIANAIAQGFDTIVFITQRQHHQQLTELIIEHLPAHITTHIVYQDNTHLPAGCIIAKNRDKPLGTAHALWCAKALIKTSFVVINADDYYGAQAFSLVRTYGIPNPAYMVAYQVTRTLSANGGVNRGLCQLSKEHYLVGVEEITDIRYRAAEQLSGISLDHTEVTLADTALVSMNFWCFNQQIFSIIEHLLVQTFNREDLSERECYLPDAVMQLIHTSPSQVKVLTSQDAWFGVTYAADSALVNAQLSQLIDQGLFTSLQP